MKLRPLTLLLCALLAAACSRPSKDDGWWQMRGIVLSTKELAEVDWPLLAADNGINTIGTHITPSEVLAFLATDKGRAFIAACRKHGITVEHQLHAMGELLPRDLFSEDPEMFRMDASGERTADFNCCVHSEKALDIIASNAARLAKQLRPGNHRYYFWLDDNAPVCCCPLCRDFSPSEQALIVENRMLQAIRKVDPKARLAHLAYSHFMDPPVKVQPDEGIFLEFAPIYRSWDVPLVVEDALCPRGYPVSNGDNLRWLEANLQVFDAEDAVVLEYWLDASLFSRWKRPAVELPWRPDVCRSDLATYARYGIRHVTSFAVYMDAEYFERFPSTAPVEQYGAMLRTFRHFRGLSDPWDGLTDGAQVSVCFDGKALSFCFEVPDSTLTVCDGPGERSVDFSDRAEIFLSCDPAMARYYGFEIDAAGKVMDYRNSFYRQFDYDWTGQVAAEGTAPLAHTGSSQAGYRVEASFTMDYLRQLGVVQPDGTVLMGLFRADALGSEPVRPDGTPADIRWYTLRDPSTPEPDFHIPATLFPYQL